jgi:ABC-2 type transport system ATP-binding protein
MNSTCHQSTSSSEPAIQTTDLRKTYYSKNSTPKEALKGISLTIPKGSIFGLLGPNGAGKSTFINILAGLVIKSSGTAKIWGFDQDVNPRMSRASIGVVPQELNIDPFFTPKRAMDVQAGLYGVPKSQRRTMEILNALGLADKANSYARTLSGGMRRRLLVAKAMVHNPAVLVLDEPTAGVDIELRRQLWDYVRTLNEQGVTIILTTHYLEEAQEMCDHIAIINQGEVVANDSTQSLLNRIDTKILCVQTPSQNIEDLTKPGAFPQGVTAEIKNQDGGDARQTIEITYSKKNPCLAQIVTVLQNMGVEIQDITTREPDLEDVFLSLTSKK